MIRKFFNLALIVTLAVTVALAQQPTSSTPSVDRIRQVITYLASDALEGRRTGTAGANDAAHYIVGEFNRHGLRPGMQMARPARTRGENQARYLQPFPYVAGVELGKGNLFFANPGRANDIAQFRVGEDWMPLGFSSSGRVENAGAVFVGYSIVASELKYDDYAGVDATGKVAVAFEGSPDDNPHGKFAQFGDVRFKAAAARDHGARALIVIASDETFKDDRLSRLHFEHISGDAGLPVVVVSRQTAVKLLKLDGLVVLARMESEMSSWVMGGGVAANCKEPCGVTHNFKPAADGVVNITTNIIRRESPSFNVVGILPGSDPKLKDEAIVIGAHYDHLGRGGEGSLAPREGEIHHGADDNASGVAGLIELARLLSSQNPKPRRTIVFIAFSGEEEGLIGSNYYVNHPIVPLANTAAMINMDMIGRLKDNKLIVGGMGTAPDWRPLIDKENAGNFAVAAVASTTGMKGATNAAAGSSAATKFSLTLNEDGFGPSDHSSFYAKQVPVLFFWTGNHEDYHKPSDTADKINYEGEARIVAFVANIIHDVDKNDKRPTYTVAKSESQGRTMGFRVYLGTIPNYADSNDGLKLDGVRDDSPAAKAGLQAGDKIVKMAGREVKNVYDYTYALGEMKAGQEYEVEIVRGSERLTLKITPAARK
jgi:aminopeptidase YwaD